MKIAIYGSRRQDDNYGRIADFLDALKARNVEVVMHRKLYDALVGAIPLHLGCVTKVTNTGDFAAELVLSIGGDGTFLRTAVWVGDKQIPILGVNAGHLGYLSGASVAELPGLVDEIVNRGWQVERRSLIHVAQPQLPFWPYALNEVTIAKEDSASIIVADATIDSAPLATYSADGLIISTPTGSTAYNLSVGGPIIQPTAPVWAITPIAAHSLGLRPLVVSDDALIDVCVSGRARSFRLTLDGRSASLPFGGVVELRKAPFSIYIVRRKGHEFPAHLREKLKWGE